MVARTIVRAMPRVIPRVEIGVVETVVVITRAPIEVVVIWVVAVVERAITIVVRPTPTTKHVGDIARLYPHLVTHNHHGVESRVVGHGEEIGITIAVVPIG